MAIWEHSTAMLPHPPIRSRKCPKRGQKPGKRRGLRRKISPFSKGKRNKNSLKTQERSANVYENKGSDFRGPGRSWNVIENTGGYALGTGILLKIK